MNAALSVTTWLSAVVTDPVTDTDQLPDWVAATVPLTPTVPVTATLPEIDTVPSTVIDPPLSVTGTGWPEASIRRLPLLSVTQIIS